MKIITTKGLILSFKKLHGLVRRHLSIHGKRLQFNSACSSFRESRSHELLELRSIELFDRITTLYLQKPSHILKQRYSKNLLPETILKKLLKIKSLFEVKMKSYSSRKQY